MQLIENHNCVATCLQKYCDTEEKYFETIKIKGLEIHIVLCEKHMEEWEEFTNG